MNFPQHIGIIPDGNRRWAKAKGLNKEEGYVYGLAPGLQLLKLAQKTGVKEITYYGFTMDNTKRKNVQTQAFTKACIEAVKMIAYEDVELLVVGNTESPKFPTELLPYTGARTTFGKGGIKVNFLVNYGWHWDLGNLEEHEASSKTGIISSLQSKQISRIDLIIRWGYRRRLSGFLPAQSVYADFYVVDKLWPDFEITDFYEALEWYKEQDVTLGG